MPIELALFGAFSLVEDSTAVRVPLSEQRLLAFLGVLGPSERQTVAGALWPDVIGARASSSLRTVLSKVRRRCGGVVRDGGSHLALCTGVAVDVQQLRAVAARVVGGIPVDVDDALQLLHLRGDLLPAWDDEWLIFEREEIRQVRLQALECCADWLCRAGDFGPAMMLVYEAVRVDPLRESAHRKLIGIHLAQGNRVQAMRAYQTFSRQLWRECGVQPSPMLEELVSARGGGAKIGNSPHAFGPANS
ncbi:BTAD domain-containing putative transcriptional regulator [Actinoplanes sp. NPDC000266]